MVLQVCLANMVYLDFQYVDLLFLLDEQIIEMILPKMITAIIAVF